MESIAYADFSRSLHRSVVAGRVPVSGTIEVTRRCPLECLHCYNNLPMGDVRARERELSLAEHVRILDEIAEAGCLWLLYTGGEIFARPDFLEIYRAARERGFFITLFTNATLITPRIADFLAGHRPFAVEVTLYGHTRETYEALTGIPGSHARCRRGIELLLERGLPLALKTVGVTTNRHEIGAMKRFAEGLGVDFKFDSMINPRVDCSRSPLAVRLRPEEIVALDFQDPERVTAWQELTARAIHPAPEGDEVYHCGGGLHSFAIDPYGRMSLCILSEVEKYDLRDGSFRDGWDRFLHAVRHQPRSRRTKCVACQLKDLCGMCPANGELENGDKESPVDFLCHVAHLRARALGVDVPPHGECEYCEGGSRHTALLEAVARLSALQRTPGGEPLFTAPESRTFALPMLGEARSASGCAGYRPGGCGACGSG